MAVLRHPLFDQVRAAERAQAMFPRAAADLAGPAGVLTEGTIDLAFEDGRRQPFVVLDFKTDRELDVECERYRRQLAIYCQALPSPQGRPPGGFSCGYDCRASTPNSPTSNSQGEMF